MTQAAVKERMYIRWIETLSSKDRSLVGGKNASLGQMIKTLKDIGVSVPYGFATTADAYQDFLAVNDIVPKIHSLVNRLKTGKMPLEAAGAALRDLFLQARFPDRLAQEICDTYHDLSRLQGREFLDVAVRSSATAEDLPEASFAGMLDSFLNVRGKVSLLHACRRCYASLFTDRAISYMEQMGFNAMDISLSIGIQQMVRSDQAGAGVMFSIDNKTGFPEVVVITAGWGLGENVVQGIIIPDEYRVYKPFLHKTDRNAIIEKTIGDKGLKRVYVDNEGGGTRNVDTDAEERASFVLNSDEILQLAHWACVIEEKSAMPMDMEWAKDGRTGQLYLLQARPVTGHVRHGPDKLTTHRLKEKKKPLLRGVSIGEGIATGKVCIIRNYKEIDQLVDSSIMVSEMGNTGWTSTMRKRQAKGLVTDFGGRNSHSAIISRELGIPGILATYKATEILKPGQEITITSIEGDEGFVYDGVLEYDTEEIDLSDIPETRMKIMMNVGSEAVALQWWRLPCDGIGLVRTEYILRHIIQVHPMALVHPEDVKDESTLNEIRLLTRGYSDRPAYFINHLSNCVAQIAACRYPATVLVRLSNFETYEYASLKAGGEFEPRNNDTQLGLRGVSRYLSDYYRDGFALECQALKRVREEMKFTNVGIMIPYCETVKDADSILKALAENGLKQGQDGFQIHLSCDIPSNFTHMSALAERFNGFSVAASKLRGLLKGSKSKSTTNSKINKNLNASVEEIVGRLVEVVHRAGGIITMRGRTFSHSHNLVKLLVDAGIDALSVNPEGIYRIKRIVAEAEKGQREGTGEL